MDAEQIKTIFLKIIAKLLPSSIWNWDYVGSLWDKYANLGGFFTGIILLAIVYFAGDSLDDASIKKRGMIRVFALIAFINALDGVYFLLESLINNYLLHIDATMLELSLDGAFNPLSIMVLCLVVSECYRNSSGKAFFFGVSTFGVSMLMFGSGYTQEVVLIFLFIRVILAGAICSMCTKPKYLYTSYIIMSIYFVVTQAIFSFLLYVNLEQDVEVLKTSTIWIKDIPKILLQFKAEYISILFIMLIWILFEQFILKERVPKAKKTTTAA